MTLPARFSNVPRRALKLILTEKMFWEIHNLNHLEGSPQEKIRTILERYLSREEKVIEP